MITIQGSLPRNIYVACSGGVDSMAALHFLSQNHKVTVLHFHHGNEFANEELAFVVSFCNKHNIPYKLGTLSKEKPANESLEEFWRNERYAFFKNFSDAPIVTCHHLDDCVETWIWSSFHGAGKIIPYQNQNVIRPFRKTRKSDFINWCKSHNVMWLEDKSNLDVKFMRNFIRHEIMAKALIVNPGLYKTILKKVTND